MPTRASRGGKRADFSQIAVGIVQATGGPLTAAGDLADVEQLEPPPRGKAGRRRR